MLPQKQMCYLYNKRNLEGPLHWCDKMMYLLQIVYYTIKYGTFRVKFKNLSNF